MSRAGRLILVRILGEQCKNCGNKVNLVIHHIDGDHDNDALSNLMLLCNSCHSKVHNTGVTHAKRNRQQSVPHDGILEYLSRPTRRKITHALCKELIKKQEEAIKSKWVFRGRGRPDYHGMSILSNILGVSRKTVSRWINQDMQGSNKNVKKMLRLAKVEIPDELSEILFEDLSEYRKRIRSFLDV